MKLNDYKLCCHIWCVSAKRVEFAEPLSFIVNSEVCVCFTTEKQRFIGGSQARPWCRQRHVSVKPLQNERVSVIKPRYLVFQPKISVCVKDFETINLLVVLFSNLLQA